MVLGPPATRAEGYLAEILGELRALRAALTEDPPTAVEAPGTSALSRPTKRTRSRPPRTAA